MRYKVDLRQYMAECDINYQQLVCIFPAMITEDTFKLSLGECRLEIEVLERMPYTTELELTLKGGTQTVNWLNESSMKVRLYHDLQSAEVHEFGNSRRPAPRSPYPNSQMHHHDEKLQWNRFLREWLGHARANGYITDSVITMP